MALTLASNKRTSKFISSGEMHKRDRNSNENNLHKQLGIHSQCDKHQQHFDHIVILIHSVNTVTLASKEWLSPSFFILYILLLWLQKNGCLGNQRCYSIGVHVGRWPTVFEVPFAFTFCFTSNSNRSSTICNSP